MKRRWETVVGFGDPKQEDKIIVTVFRDRVVVEHLDCKGNPLNLFQLALTPEVERKLLQARGSIPGQYPQFREYGLKHMEPEGSC